nr:PREDICTED: caspase-1-like isoform X2 [Rhinolophus sinicus]
MADKRLNEKRIIFVNSVSEGTLNNLLDDVLSKKVLNQEEIEIIKKRNVTTIAKARDLIDFVTRKGSHASKLFIDYICKRNSTLAYKLGFSSETSVGGKAQTSTEPIGKFKLCPREKFLELCKNEAGRDMELVLKTFAARPEHRSSDSTFLVFMSHGLLDRICGTLHSDDKSDVLAYDTIFQIFNNRHCCHLKDKPKVIIIQACRGGNQGEVWVSDSPVASADSATQYPDDLQDDGVHKTHVEKDFVAFCSSTPHNVSWRKENGSLFITELISYVKKYSWYCHLIEIFVMVQRSFEEPNVKAQMPTLERQTMTRYFYLFPGN